MDGKGAALENTEGDGAGGVHVGVRHGEIGVVGDVLETAADGPNSGQRRGSRIPTVDSVSHFKRIPQRSGVPVFSLKNSVYSRGCSAGSNHCTSSDDSLYTAARDEEYVLGQDWNICSLAAQEGFQWHW